MADLVAATVAILRDAGKAEGRVYHVELPHAEVEEQPRKAIAVRGSGGGLLSARHRMPVGDQRVDIRCYGADPWEAAELDDEVARFLHLWSDGDEGDGRVLWFAHSGGPNHLRDPSLGWPYALSTWQVLGERFD